MLAAYVPAPGAAPAPLDAPELADALQRLAGRKVALVQADGCVQGRLHPADRPDSAGRFAGTFTAAGEAQAWRAWLAVPGSGATRHQLEIGGQRAEVVAASPDGITLEGGALRPGRCPQP